MKIYIPSIDFENSNVLNYSNYTKVKVFKKKNQNAYSNNLPEYFQNLLHIQLEV